MGSMSEQPLRMLVVHPDVPPPDRDACSVRLFRMLELFASAGHRVTMLGRGGFGQSREAARLLAVGVEEVIPFDTVRLSEHNRDAGTTRWAIPPLDLAELFRRRRFDVAWLSLYEIAEQYGPLIRALSPGTRIVVDSTDVHWVREHRGATLSGNQAELAGALRTREREQAAYRAADVLVAISDADAASMHELAPEVPLGIVPIIQPFAPVDTTPDDREGVVFVANFNHAPNVDAAVHFHTHAWPLLKRALPGVHLTFAGHAPPPAVESLAASDVTVTGWVPEIEPYLARAKVSIVPLRWGAGMKGKIGQAAAAGLPVVTTSVGAEGMGLCDGEHVLIADEPEAFSEAIARVYRDEDLWRRLARNAHAHLSDMLGMGAARDAIAEVLRQAAPPRWQVAADADGLREVISEYVHTFTAGDGATLLLTVPPGAPDAPSVAFARASALLEELGVDPDSAADIDIGVWDDRLAVPARTVTFPASAKPATTAGAARARRDVAVVVQAAGDAPVLRAQLRALELTRVGEHADLIIVASVRNAEVTALLADLPHARVLRCERLLGWSHVIALGLDATTAATIVSLGPLALPQEDFVSPLVAALDAGAPLAGATVDGACGLRVAADGSLWPRADGEGGAADALALDCLAASRELWEELPRLVAESGPFESQLAGWASSRGAIVACPSSRVDRFDAGPLSVIICTQDRPQELAETVGLLVACGATRGGSEVIIVDSASSPPAAAVARRLAAEHDGVRLVREDVPGVSRARNAGAAAARNEMLAFLHDDARPAPGWRERIARSLSRPGVVAVGGPVCTLWPSGLEASATSDALAGSTRLLDLGDAELVLVPPAGPHSANSSILRATLHAAGGFPDELDSTAPSRVGGDRAVAWRLNSERLGVTVYDPGAAVGHRIDAVDLDRGTILRGRVTAGIEHARLRAERDGASPERLVAQAAEVAKCLLSAVPLSGAMTLEDAVDLVEAAPLPGLARAEAAELLGLLAGSALLLDEEEILVGDLELHLRPEHLHGMTTATSAAMAVASAGLAA
jgi:hypothetical protein